MCRHWLLLPLWAHWAGWLQLALSPDSPLKQSPTCRSSTSSLQIQTSAALLTPFSHSDCSNLLCLTRVFAQLYMSKKTAHKMHRYSLGRHHVERTTGILLESFQILCACAGSWIVVSLRCAATQTTLERFCYGHLSQSWLARTGSLPSTPGLLPALPSPLSCWYSPLVRDSAPKCDLLLWCENSLHAIRTSCSGQVKR
jgi:hypothetical protein